MGRFLCHVLLICKKKISRTSSGVVSCRLLRDGGAQLKVVDCFTGTATDPSDVKY